MANACRHSELQRPFVRGLGFVSASIEQESSRYEYRELPVVVVTSRSGDKHRAAAEAVGASDYLTKPFTLERLGEAIDRWVPQP